MVKLKSSINKTDVLRKLRKEAEIGYEKSWEKEYALEYFMKGVERTFKELTLQRQLPYIESPVKDFGDANPHLLLKFYTEETTYGGSIPDTA